MIRVLIDVSSYMLWDHDQVLCSRRDTIIAGQGNHSTPALESYKGCSGKKFTSGHQVYQVFYDTCCGPLIIWLHGFFYEYQEKVLVIVFLQYILQS